MTPRQTKTTTQPFGVRAAVVRTAGTNCDRETAHALEEAGATCDLIHINQLLTGRMRLHPYQILVIPGGFSYGDDISAGKMLAVQIKHRLQEQLARFTQARKLVIGICNGFQVLVKAGLLPGLEGAIDNQQTVTLALNDSSRFQCEWTTLKTEASAATWLSLMPRSFPLPIAHGEGKFITARASVLKTLKDNRQVVFRYEPKNPNGSEHDIAGLCNPAGNVLGMMPHPERFLTAFEHPDWPRQGGHRAAPGAGLRFWQSAVTYGHSLL